MESLIKLGFFPDVIHANDWQSALAVIYLKTKYANVYPLSKIKTVYTIHNIEYQGKYGMEILGDIFALDGFGNVVEWQGCINLMKGALVTTDFITTVSPNYAYELHHDFFAFGLAEIINVVGAKMVGVINGIDYNHAIFAVMQKWPEEARELKMTTNIWTVNKENQIRKAAGHGIMYVTTDNPLEARKVLKEEGKKEVR